jgi:hypothetical protein
MDKNKRTTAAGKKKTLLIWSFLVLAILAAALIAWQFYKYKIVNNAIAQAFTKKTDNLYRLHYDQIQMDELKGTLQIRNIEILADTDAHNKAASTYLRSLSIPELNILGVKTPKALLGKQIEGRTVELINPTIELEMDNLPIDSGLALTNLPIYKEVLGNFLQMKFDSIQVSHANLRVRNSRTKMIAYEADNISLLFSDLLIDSTTSRDSSRFLFSKNFDLTCEAFKFPTNDKQYRFSVDSIHFSSRKNALQIAKIHIAPLLSEEVFVRTFRMDRFDFLLEGIQLLHINLNSLKNEQIEADQLVINRSSFKIFWDLAYSSDTLTRKHMYPQKQIQGLPIPILIRKIVFVHSFVEYREQNPRSDSSGRLQFTQAHATITNFTNRFPDVSRNNKCTILFYAKLLNKVAVHAKVTLLLKQPNGNFTFQGYSDNVDARELNPLSVPMGMIRIEKGDIKKCQFYFDANDSISDGKILILYHDLKISPLRKNKNETKYSSKIFSGLASDLIIRKSNPGNNKTERGSTVHYKWVDTKSFLNVIWNSIFIGIKETMGLKK